MVPPHAHKHTPAPSRLPQLDALRGIAALSVAIWHHFLVLPTAGPPGPYVRAGAIFHAMHYSPLYVLFAGHEPVILFFVLSGFVLVLPWASGDGPPYAAFIIRRCARIYIPYAAAVTIAALMSVTLPPGPLAGLSDWANTSWSKPVDRNVLLGHLLLVGVFDTSRLAPVFWTLVQEMRVSICFPMIALFVMRASWRFVLGTALVTSLTVIVLGAHIPYPVVQDLLGTLHFASLFAAGALLAKNMDVLLQAWRRLRPSVRAMAVSAAIFCYVYGRSANRIMQPLGDWPIAAGVCVLFLFALESQSFGAGLVSRVPQFLGRISYSYYLLHTVVLIGLLHALYGRIPLVLILVMSVVLGFLSAYASYRVIELPAIRLGRVISERFVRKQADAALRLE